MHWRQGLVLGHVDRLTDAMVVGEGTARRVLTFGEFETRIRTDPDFRTFFEPAIDILLGFDFTSRPVLARILLAQAVLHRLVLYTYTCTPSIEGLSAAAERFVRSAEFAADLETALRAAGYRPGPVWCKNCQFAQHVHSEENGKLVAPGCTGFEEAPETKQEPAT